jgi:hypothetical protein
MSWPLSFDAVLDDKGNTSGGPRTPSFLIRRYRQLELFHPFLCLSSLRFERFGLPLYFDEPRFYAP